MYKYMIGVFLIAAIAGIMNCQKTSAVEWKPVEPEWKPVSPQGPQDSLTRMPPVDGIVAWPANSADIISPVLIGGTEVPKTDPVYNKIVRIRCGNSMCTAPLVGEQAILTAAHCASNGSTCTFNSNGKSYSAKITRSNLYPQIDHDLALGFVSKKVETDEFMSVVNRTVDSGDPVTLWGYGCVKPGGSGGNDGTLRKGPSQIIGFSGKDFIAKKSGGAALCFGDSGGPTTDAPPKEDIVMGINSKGNISDTSYLARLDNQETKDFFKKWTEENQTYICGYNKDCGGPQPEKIEIQSEKIGSLEIILKPDTLEPDYVKRQAGDFMRFLEWSLEATLEGDITSEMCTQHFAN